MTAALPATGPDLDGYLAVLGRQRRTIVVLALGAALVGLLLGLMRAPAHLGRAEVLLEGITGLEELGDRNTPRLLGDAQQEARFFESDTFRRAVRSQLRAAPPRATIRPLGSRDILAVIVPGPNRTTAAQRATLYAETYVELRRQQVTDALERVRKQRIDSAAELRGGLSSPAGLGPEGLDRLVAAARLLIEASDRTEPQQIEAAASTLSEALGGTEATGLSAAFAAARIAGLEREADDLTTAIAAVSGGMAQVSAKGIGFSKAAQPGPAAAAALAGLLGLLIGLAVAFIRDYMDDTIHDRAGIVRSSGSLPVLAWIPPPPGQVQARASSSVEPSPAQSDALAALRLALDGGGGDSRIGRLLLVPAGTQPDKAEVLLGLGMTFARTGRKVVVVASDLRQPVNGLQLGWEDTGGLAAVLTGEADLSDELREVGDVPGLQVLPPGRSLPSPTDALSSAAFSELMARLGADADVLLLDAPPLSTSPDGLALALTVDRVVLTARLGTTTAEQLRSAIDRLRQFHVEVLGLVVSNAPDIG